MRDPRDKFKPIDEVQAAAGIKIASPELDGVLPGTTVYASSKLMKLQMNLRKHLNLKWNLSLLIQKQLV